MGEWTKEPDKVEWVRYGLPCLIIRSPTGALNGYVGVFPGHPCYGLKYDDIHNNVHGGLTFADFGGGEYISHYQAQNAYFIGFDCAHAGDIIPLLLSYQHIGITKDASGKKFPPYPTSDTYKNVEYVKLQVEKLASEFADLKCLICKHKYKSHSLGVCKITKTGRKICDCRKYHSVYKIMKD